MMSVSESFESWNKPNLFRKSCILFQELDDTISQLRMIHTQALNLMQRYQYPCEKQLVFLFQRKGKPVDDRPEDLQKFRNTVESFRFVNELKKYIIDGPSYIWP